jgi:hypothetical protein
MRYVYAVLLAVLIGGGVWVWVDGSANDASSQTTNLAVSTTDTAPQDASGDRSTTSNAKQPLTQTANAAQRPDARSDRLLDSRLEVMHQRRHGQTYSTEAVAAAVVRHTAWKPADEVPKSLPLKPEEFTDGRQFIQLDPLKIESLIPGDTFLVTVEKLGAQYRVEIDSVEVHDGGRISWHGHLAGLSEHYNVTFTRGASLTVGGLETPEGHYVLQAHGPNGWIASSKLLFKFDTTKTPTDAIVPPADGHDVH